MNTTVIKSGRQEDLLVFQNNPNNLPIIQTSGCFARCAQGIAELFSGKYLSSDQINEVWAWGRTKELIVNSKKKLVIDENNNINSSAAIANRVLQIVEAPGRILEVGTKQAGVINWYGWAKGNPLYQRADAFIQKIAQSGPQKIHFRLVNKDESLRWDPHNPQILCKGVIYTIVYCYQADYRRAL
jgi:hypothetical protein